MNISTILNQIENSKNFLTREELRHFLISLMKDGETGLEFGVFNGASINYFAAACPKNIFYGFDSFEGLPVDWLPTHPAGSFKTDFNKLRFHTNIIIKKGWFNETIPPFLNEIDLESVKFIHIDCDIYDSTKTILNDIVAKLDHPVYLLFDEFYNYQGFDKHEILAFIEFINETGVKYKVIGKNIRHQQVLILINSD